MVRKAVLKPAFVLVALALILVPIGSGTAGAVSPLPVVCTAVGTITFQNGTNTAWQLVGRGSCEGDLGGTYFLDFVGSGTSDSLGNCDAMNGGFIVPVTNLDINVVGTLLNAATLVPKPLVQNWSAPLTTYPVATPFLVSEGGDLVGAGVWLNHIFIQCLNSPVAHFEFGFVT